MHVLITGIGGNVGRSTAVALLRRGHKVTGVDVASRKNRRLAERWRKRVEFVFGDIRSESVLRAVLPGKDVVIHLAAVIPPEADHDPQFAESVNIGATRTLAAVMQSMSPVPRLVFTSSISVYGDRVQTPYIGQRDDIRPNQNDHYAHHKIACEQLIRSSSIPWTILRLSYIVSVDKLKMDPILFDMPLATAIEPCLTQDAGNACAAAAERADLSGRTFLIAGGQQSRTMYRDYLDAMLRAFGLGGMFLPEQAFARSGFHCAFMDTSESERELRYQHHTLDDYYRDVWRKSRLRRWLVRAIRPVARGYILTRSSYFRRYLLGRYHTATARLLGTVAFSLGILPRRSVRSM